MGPFTHALEVSRLIVRHILGAEGDAQRLADKPWSQANTPPVFAQRSEVVS
jgi:hypothetical protein